MLIGRRPVVPEGVHLEDARPQRQKCGLTKANEQPQPLYRRIQAQTKWTLRRPQRWTSLSDGFDQASGRPGEPREGRRRGRTARRRRPGHPLRPLPLPGGAHGRRPGPRDPRGQHGAGRRSDPPRPSLRRVVAPDPLLLEDRGRHRSLLAATHRDLPVARIRQHHDQVMARVERLIARGQDEGDFRTDLPAPGWWRPSTA